MMAKRKLEETDFGGHDLDSVKTPSLLPQKDSSEQFVTQCSEESHLNKNYSPSSTNSKFFISKVPENSLQDPAKTNVLCDENITSSFNLNMNNKVNCFKNVLLADSTLLDREHVTENVLDSNCLSSTPENHSSRMKEQPEKCYSVDDVSGSADSCSEKGLSEMSKESSSIAESQQIAENGENKNSVTNQNCAFSQESINNSAHGTTSESCPTETTNAGILNGIIKKTPKKKPKRNVKFDAVTVYFFPRTQGFTCVPSQGGSTLGMAKTHSISAKYTVNEHLMEKRHHHLEILRQRHRQQQNPKLKNNSSPSMPSSSSENEEDESEDESDLDVDDYCFLQPVNTRLRRMILRNCGVRKIESVEKEECRDIRLSRELCGCDCKIYCDPETCSCAEAGIKCQVDRMSFPCGCTKDGCGNQNGRIEFNPIRVRTHFIHTLMRMELDKKQSEQQEAVRNGLRLDQGSANCSSFSANDSGMFMNHYNKQHNHVGHYPPQEASYPSVPPGQVNSMNLHDAYYPATTSSINCAQSENNIRIEHAGLTHDTPLLFNDSDDEFNHTENTTGIYNAFRQDDSSSYSESSDGSNESPEVLHSTSSAQGMDFQNFFNREDVQQVQGFGDSFCSSSHYTTGAVHSNNYAATTSSETSCYNTGITTFITEANNVVNNTTFDLPSTMPNGHMYPSGIESSIVYSVASCQERQNFGFSDDQLNGNEVYSISEINCDRNDMNYNGPSLNNSKYTELTSATCKLEPISEILTPPLFSQTVPCSDSFTVLSTNAEGFSCSHSTNAQSGTPYDHTSSNIYSYHNLDESNINVNEFHSERKESQYRSQTNAEYGSNHGSYTNSQSYQNCEVEKGVASSSKDDDNHQESNFGEIIKKSLVETVSA